MRVSTCRMVALTVLVALTSFLAACGSESDDTPPTATQSATAAPSNTTATATLTSTVEMQSASPVPSTTTGATPTSTVEMQLPPSGSDANGDGWYTATEFREAILALFPFYRFPDNYQLDPESWTAFFVSGQNADGGHEVPGEYTFIGTAFSCAWILTWLDAFQTGDTATMADSISQLRWELSIRPSSMISPDAIDHSSGLYDSAELGDPGPLQDYAYRASCGAYPWIGRASPTP